MMQIPREQWDEITWPFDVCQVPMSVNDVEKKTGLEFFEYSDDGLGVVFGCYISSSSGKAFIKGFHNKDDVQIGLLVSVRSFEPIAEEVVKEVCDEVGVSFDDLTWVSDELYEDRWYVKPSPDSKDKMLCFYQESSARLYAKKIEDDSGLRCDVFRAGTGGIDKG